MAITASAARHPVAATGTTTTATANMETALRITTAKTNNSNNVKRTSMVLPSPPPSPTLDTLADLPQQHPRLQPHAPLQELARTPTATIMRSLSTHTVLKHIHAPDLAHNESTIHSHLSRTLNLRGIIPLLDVITTTTDRNTTTTVLVTPLHGTDLHAHTHTHTLTPTHTRTIFARAALALWELHAAGFHHGDIKAENILIGGDHDVVLCDLGHAGPVGRRMRRYGTRELAPPAFDGCGPRGDVWGLGLVLASLVAGRRVLSRDVVECGVGAVECDEYGCEGLLEGMLDIDGARRWSVDDVVLWLQEHRWI